MSADLNVPVLGFSIAITLIGVIGAWLFMVGSENVKNDNLKVSIFSIVFAIGLVLGIIVVWPALPLSS